MSSTEYFVKKGVKKRAQSKSPKKEEQTPTKFVPKAIILKIRQI